MDKGLTFNIFSGWLLRELFVPPVMAWALKSRLAESNEVYRARDVQVTVGRVALSNVKPILVWLESRTPLLCDCNGTGVSGSPSCKPSVSPF